jgi:hypothetical protein
MKKTSPGGFGFLVSALGVGTRTNPAASRYPL